MTLRANQRAGSMALKKNVLSVVIICFLGIILVLFITAFGLSLAKNADITEQISKKYSDINKYVDRSKMPITEKSVLFLIEERNRLKNVYSRFKLAFITPLTEEIPEESIDPLQFKERLVQTQKKLRKDAEGYDLVLPESLGFTKYETELSDASEIPALIRRLRVLEELIFHMGLSGIDSLSELSFIGELVKKEEDSVKVVGLSFDIPVSFKINCVASELVDFLYKLRVSHFTLIVEDIDIKKIADASDEDMAVTSVLEVNFLINAVAIN